MKTYKQALMISAKAISFTLLAGLAVLGLSSCGSDSKPMQQDFDRANAPITITIHVYDSKRQVTEAYLEHMGEEISQDKFKDEMREGWATWSPAGANGVPMCEIHVTKPKGTRDSNELRTWGHELVHCVYGRYHKPGQN